LLVLLPFIVFAQNGKYMGQVKIYPTPAGESINYNITAGNPSTAFRIDSKTGEIYINSQSAIDNHGWDYVLDIRLRYSANGVVLRDSMVKFKFDSRYSKLVNEIRENPIQKNVFINYNIMSGNFSTAFSIDPKVGAIFINNQAAIDEYKKSYKLIVRLRYSDLTGRLIGDKMRTIKILNITNGMFVGNIVAIDDDNILRPTQTLTYRIMSGNISTAFKVTTKQNMNNYYGEITVANAPAINNWFKTKDLYTLNVRVRDNGNPTKEAFGDVILYLVQPGISRIDVFNCR